MIENSINTQINAYQPNQPEYSISNALRINKRIQTQEIVINHSLHTIINTS